MGFGAQCLCLEVRAWIWLPGLDFRVWRWILILDSGLFGMALSHDGFGAQGLDFRVWRWILTLGLGLGFGSLGRGPPMLFAIILWVCRMLDLKCGAGFGSPGLDLGLAA